MFYSCVNFALFGYNLGTIQNIGGTLVIECTPFFVLFEMLMYDFSYDLKAVCVQFGLVIVQLTEYIR